MKVRVFGLAVFLVAGLALSASTGAPGQAGYKSSHALALRSAGGGAPTVSTAAGLTCTTRLQSWGSYHHRCPRRDWVVTKVQILNGSTNPIALIDCAEITVTCR